MTSALSNGVESTIQWLQLSFFQFNSREEVAVTVGNFLKTIAALIHVVQNHLSFTVSINFPRKPSPSGKNTLRLEDALNHDI